MQKFSSLLLALIACAGTMFASTKIGDLYYNLDATNQTAEVTSQNGGHPYWSTTITTANIPSSVTYNSVSYSVTSIGDHAFSWCYSLTSVTIPNSVTSIGDFAFCFCSGLTSITIPNSVTSIGGAAFEDCSGLTSVTISNSVTSIEDGTFSNCTGLTSVTIPNSVTSIGGAAFEDCSGLTSINVASDHPNYSSVNGVLFNKNRTTLISYPCGKQGAYSIPNSVTSIGNYAFVICRGLTSVTIPNSVTSIGYGAFSDCTGLTSVTCFATTPPGMGEYVFYNVNRSQIPLYVPAGSISAYKSADQWKDFTNILPIGAQPVDVTTPTIEPDATSAEIAWPQVSGAYSYELVIKDASGNTICTLVFNAQGQLTSITFNAPARENAEQQTQSAGFVFTVNGLEPGTQYNYSIIAKNESGATLNTEQGSFTTTGGMQALENPSAKFDKSRKLLREGQILIQKGDHTYTLTGQQLK